MPGYKNYTIKKYEKGGLVETKEYKDGKTTVTESTRLGFGDLIPLSIMKIIDEDSKKDPSKRLSKFSKAKPK